MQYHVTSSTAECMPFQFTPINSEFYEQIYPFANFTSQHLTHLIGMQYQNKNTLMAPLTLVCQSQPQYPDNKSKIVRQKHQNSSSLSHKFQLTVSCLAYYFHR